MKSVLAGALGALLLVAAVSFAIATESAMFSGIVEDPDGYPVPNAHVRLLDRTGGIHTSVTAGETGRFELQAPTGDYMLRVTAEGFKDLITSVKIAPGKPPLRVQMTIAAAKEELTVSAQSLDPVSADGSMSALQVDKDLLKSLPEKNGNPLAAAALFLDPAAVDTEGVKIVVDGVEGTDLDVPASSVKKVFLNKNPYAAEFSRPGKGRIEVLTRPGSHTRVHHRAFLTFRNSMFDAGNAFAKTKPDMNRVLGEGELDGPLPGQRGTFYLGGDYLRDDQNAFVHALTPKGLVSGSVSTPQRTGHVLGRTDWQLNPVHTLSLRYGFRKDVRRNQGSGGFDLAERGYEAQQLGHEFRVSETANLSANFSNDIGFVFKYRGRDAVAVSTAPATIVLGAFSSGGAQIAQHQSERKTEVQDLLSMVHGKHMLRLGASVKHRAMEVRDESNFGGTFTFSSLADFEAGRPILFSGNRGNPAASFHYVEYSWFVQDEIRLRKDLGLMLGLRHELQSSLSDHNNIAPRVAISYAPGAARTVFRAGAGIFYQREPWNMLQAATLLDGEHLRQTIITNPEFPNLSAAAQPAPSVNRIGANLRAPYALQVSSAIEHKFGKRTFLSVEYTAMRGRKLFRMRDVNVSPDGRRLDPNFNNIYQFESAGHSSSNALGFTFRTGVKRFELMSQYTLARSLDDTSGPFFLPVSSFDLRSEWGRSDYDRRQRFNFAGIARLPGEVKVGMIASLTSGMPFNIVTGGEGDGDGAVNDRPAGVARNTGKGPGYANIDVRLAKRFRMMKAKSETSEKAPYLELRLDAFNLFNFVNAQNYVGTITSPLFGRANEALPGRQMQASVKMSF